MDNSTWEIVRPKYEIALATSEAQWFYFEGHSWGRLEEIEKQESLHLAYQREIAQRDETIQAQEVMIRGLRNDFTHKSTRRSNA